MFLRSERFTRARRFFLVATTDYPLLLLATDLTLRSLAGTSIRMGALTANGQATTMTQTAIATDLHEALNILRNFAM